MQPLYYEHFEKYHSIYFKQGTSHHKYQITHIKDDTDCSIKRTKGILREFNNFFGNIYWSKQLDPSPTIIHKFFPPENNPFLPMQEQNALSAPITQEELYKALQDMFNFKVPGSDGFTVEFFKAYWEDIKDYYFAALEDSLSKGEMGIDQRRGTIILLPKKGKDLKRVTNWRPITLLNVDYKIIVKAISTWLKVILHKLIHQDQRAFVPGRYIDENIINLYTILDKLEEENQAGLFVSTDFYKAFDSIEWSFMEKVIDYFDLPVFIKYWFQTYITIYWVGSWVILQKAYNRGHPYL